MKKRSLREIRNQLPTFHNNNSSIQELSSVFICSKCNKYNTIFQQNIQNCLFCGNPNYIKRK